MAKVPLTPALRQEYQTLFDSCVVQSARAARVDQICDAIVECRARYEAVARTSGVPWSFVAVVHNMECDRRFDRHLHNGDPLRARTVQVPAGRPRTGNPPFTWEASCADALDCRGLCAPRDWSLTGTLYELEGYNGFGYRIYHPHVKSPYLWSFSNHYVRGKYVSDGTWSDAERSQQCGAAVLLRRLAERGEVRFADQAPPSNGAPPLVPYATRRPDDAAAAARAEALQRWLNTLPGVFVKVDGVAGERTSNAVRQALGTYLPGDPRAGAATAARRLRVRS
jgi:lysozyme family protein